jgi:hypothetical protein
MPCIQEGKVNALPRLLACLPWLPWNSNPRHSHSSTCYNIWRKFDEPVMCWQADARIGVPNTGCPFISRGPWTLANPGLPITRSFILLLIRICQTVRRVAWITHNLNQKCLCVCLCVCWHDAYCCCVVFCKKIARSLHSILLQSKANSRQHL